MGCYQKYVQNYATIAHPLANLFKEREAWSYQRWHGSSNARSPLNTLKKHSLTYSPVLKVPYVTEQIINALCLASMSLQKQYPQ